MPKRSGKSDAEQFNEVKQFRSAEEIHGGIEKLKRRQAEVEVLNGLRYDDQRVNNAAQNIRTAILEIFGPNSPEYGEHRYHEIYHGGSETWQMEGVQALQHSFQAGIPQTITLIQGLIARLEEKLTDLQGDATARVRSAFESMELHPRVAGASSDLYRDRHYRQSVLDASIALVNYVKEKSRRHDLDGAALMSTVFSPNSPVLAFNALADQTDKDEQQGMMHLFMGAVLALRNPRAHSVFDDSPELALDYIAFLSMLAKRLEGAKRV
jgi:uncharacterized protein (TIGR02391 family)